MVFFTQEVALKATRPVFAVAGGVAGGLYSTFNVIILSNSENLIEFNHSNQ